MNIKRGPKFSTRLEKLKRRFETWRKTKTGRSPIPETLWRSAVKLAEASNINRVSKALHLNHTTLKERMMTDTDASFSFQESPEPLFVELDSPSKPLSECFIELEKSDGAKMKLHFNKTQDVDFTSLIQSFWRASS